MNWQALWILKAIQMENTFPSFDLGIDHLFPSDPGKESNRKKNSALHASMLASYTTSSTELKRRQQNILQQNTQ